MVDAPGSSTSSGVPPGFEHLVIGADETDVIVDLFLFDQFLGAYRAEYQPGRLRFVQPAQVLAGLPAALQTDVVLVALGEMFPTHESLGCTGPGDAACAGLEPDPIALIYDPALYRGDLLISAGLAQRLRTDEPRLLPRSSAGWSLMQHLDGAASGSLGGSGRESLRSRTVLAHRERRAIAEWTQTDDGRRRFDTLAGEVDMHGMTLTGGLIQSTGSSVEPSRTAVGVRAARELRLLADYDAQLGALLEVFLAAESFVQVFRDDRLLIAVRLPPGLQRIDTSRFPQGAYPVELRIRDVASGVERREQAFVSKSRSLPVRGYPSWFAELGQFDDRFELDPQLKGRSFAQAGLAARLTEQLGAGVRAAASEDSQQLSANASWLFPGGQFNTVLQVDSGGALSSGFDGYVRFGQLSASAAWLDQRSSLMGEPTRRARLRLGYQRPGGLRVDLAGVWSEGDTEALTWGPSLRWPLHRSHSRVVDLFAQFTRSDAQDLAFVGVTISQRQARGSVGLDLGYQQAQPGEGGQPAARLATRQRLTDSVAHRVEAAATAQYQSGQAAVSVGGDYRGRLGRMNLQLSDRLGGSVDEPARYDAGMGLGFSMTLGGVALTDDGAGLGGIQIILEAPSGTPGRYQILVNNQPTATLRAGQRRTLPLTPYRRHVIQLRELDQAWVRYDSNRRAVVIYPGNVAELRWTIEPMRTVYGRLVDAEAAPLAGAVLVRQDGDGDPVRTRPTGWFQADVPATLEQLAWRVDGEICHARLVQTSALDVIHRLGDVECRFPR